jgi:hypothetical protein
MADGEQTLKVTLKLSEHALRHLKEGASKLGVSLDDYASEMLEQRLFDYDDYDWGDDDPRDRSSDAFDPSEPTYSLEETMTMFREELERRLAAKG